ncbi:sigma 54-interacting transcriptional regulator [Flavobacterium sp. NRK1]|uniref:sigma 54-interacting transcriptional regulator n=1 Tax=Flavobacterium sp. NRK1 TaxID=2954929 RepID=UPI002093F91D|nr:sigma 54-interacting transcriptional regulator [Flavobacterium sp. NRK1]MCO6149204.1 sigma 54-interacting transcriptional regulator [Flavobacterium sp. NRK1]
MGINSQHDSILQRIQEREQELKILFSLSQYFASATDIKKLDDAIQNHLKPHVLFDSFILCSGNEKTKQYSLFYHDSNKEYEQYKNEVYDIKDGFYNTCQNSAEPITISASDFKKNNTTPAFLKNTTENGIREVICIPANTTESSSIIIIGVKKPGTLSRSAMRLLKGLSVQIGITIDNINFKEQLYLQPADLSAKVSYDTISHQTVTSSLDAIIGNSKEIKIVKEKIITVANSDSGVLLLGESGTGKELIAKAIHDNSAYSNKEMIKVNCAAIPKNLIESELFGHEKGAFTGAVQQKTGKFERANNSTLFLDEIGELSPELQVKLLRVLQEKEIERIGGNVTIPVKVRIIAATNRDLQQEVANGNFRADLYYRLNVFPINIPPLRERISDLKELAAFFLQKYSGKNKIKQIAAKTLNAMKIYTWPGNIRELEHTIERAVLLSQDNVIKEIQLSTIIQDKTQKQQELFTIKPFTEFEKEYIIWVLSKCSGRISGPNGAAALLGMPPTTLQSRMIRLGIKKTHYLSQ